ncbi:MAG: PAS domain-containing sensor histidine kinase [Ignavibacteriaceae bacterium]|nr:PAS domain-containing sensor histidine kinase [Ignavibacteriaceae bacterium]
MKSEITNIFNFAAHSGLIDSGLLIGVNDSGVFEFISGGKYPFDNSHAPLFGKKIFSDSYSENDLTLFFADLIKIPLIFHKKISISEPVNQNYILFLFSESDTGINFELINEFSLLVESSVLDFKIREEKSQLLNQISESVSNLKTLLFSFKPESQKINFVTGNFSHLSSESIENLQNKPAKLFYRVDKEDYKAFKSFIRNSLSGKPAMLKYSFYDAKGNKRFLKHNYKPVIKGGMIQSVDHIIIDITEESKNEQLLKNTGQKLRTLFETAEDLIFILNPEGTFSSINNIGALCLEYQPSELTGKHFLSVIKDTDKQIVIDAFKELLNGNKPVTFETKLETKFGKTLTFEINARTIYGNESVFEGMVGIGRDVTSRKHDREKLNDLNNKLIEANRIISIERDRVKQRISVLEELNTLKSEFVANISHELRTPLASIIGFSETIDSDPEMPDNVRNDFNKIILTEAKRLNVLINDVLDISKLEGGSVSLEKADFDIVSLTDKVVDLVRKKGSEKSLIVSAELLSDPVIINADKERIKQAYENILDNAVKFSTPGGRITVYTRLNKNEFEFIVSDTGLGIPKKDMPFIFQKFYRVLRDDNTIPGSGLGLAICKQIVDLHKGFINVRSEENKGTTVIVKLPLIPRRVN